MPNEFYATFTPEERKQFDACTTPNEIAEYLRNLHGPAPEQQARDVANGRFISSTNAAPDAAAVAEKTAADAKAAADAAAAKAASREFKRVITVAGKQIEITGASADELAVAEKHARQVAEILKEDVPAPVRNIADEVWRANQLAEQFRSGVISPEQYLQASGALEAAVDKRLQEAGFDVNQAAAQQLQQSWIEAAHEFVTTPEGLDWPGGKKNKELLALKIAELGLVNSTDKVAACAQAYAALKSKGMLFNGDHDAEEMEKLAISSNATPQEILEAWKATQVVTNGDASLANEAFIQTFANGRSSGLFGK
jgi:hypothetical protein